MSEFDAAAFHQALTTRSVGRYMVYRRSIETTMVLAAREAAEGAPHGTIVLAEEQRAGRGRKGRSFQSPPGDNLYFTLVLHCPLDQHRRLPLVVPVAVLAGIRGQGLEAGIKWPNDIWIGERKVSGMLIDAEMTHQGALALPGIGINVNGDPTAIPELRNLASSLERESGHRIDREPLLAAICNELEAALSLPSKDLAARYREGSLVIGREVIVTPPAGKPYRAKAYGIAEDGSLLVERMEGGREQLNSAEVSLRPGA